MTARGIGGSLGKLQKVRLREDAKKLPRKDLWRFRVAAIGLIENGVGDHVITIEHQFENATCFILLDRAAAQPQCS